jgi:hypothetical protein
MPAFLLNIDKNPKTVKGQKKGYLTGMLYLVPGNLSGRNVCPSAKQAGCLTGCLNTAGRGAFNNVQAARIRKTQWLHNDQQTFLERLVKDIIFLQKKAEKLGLIPVVRLNGTSDICFEKMGFISPLDNKHYKNIFDVFPDIQFYDYTKLPNRRNIPTNYDLTFSYSGKPAYQRFIAQAIENGMRIAAVFRNASMIPAEFLNRATVDGDSSDLRFLDPVNSVVALYAKGRARKDFSGFVVG